MMLDVRDNIGEDVASHWGDNDILRKLNAAQRKVANLFILTTGDWLIKSTNLTPVDSVITLPDDCAKPVYMEETSSGYAVTLHGNVRDRGLTRLVGAVAYDGVVEAYMQKDAIVVNQDDYTTQVTLWYQQRVPDLHAGTAGASGVTTKLEFDLTNEPKRSDDYYNNVSIEVVDGTGAGIIEDISDYDGSGYYATITGPVASGDHYGTVSELPEESHDLIILEASLMLLVKPSSALEPSVFKYMQERTRQAREDLEEWISTRVASNPSIRSNDDY
jgi:hypothetical protein